MAVKSIREIKEEFKQIPPEKFPEYMGVYRDDEQKGRAGLSEDAGESDEKV